MDVGNHDFLVKWKIAGHRGVVEGRELLWTIVGRRGVVEGRELFWKVDGRRSAVDLRTVCRALVGRLLVTR